MNDLINGRKPEAIKIGLRNMLEACGEICGEDTRCLHDICPYDGDSGCNESILMGALALIERLEAEQPKWIKLAEETKPPRTGFYAAMVRRFGYRQETCYYNAEGDDWWSDKGARVECINGHVLYWLDNTPEPPKE